MNLNKKTNSQSGLTLMELILTVLIIVCLLAVSSVAVVKYMRHLQITSLDNSAREIYMAAQNRAILLSNSGRLEKYVVKEDNKMSNVDVSLSSEATTQITAYYIHSTDAEIATLLPEETIESSLWDGDFYIIYEPVSGSVIDVFFSKKTLPADEDNFREFYDTWRGEKKSVRMKSRPMIGYYGGESAESGNTLSLRTPVINIYNEETLWAEVTYWVPRTLEMVTPGGNVNLSVTLTYQNSEIPLSVEKKESKAEFQYIAYTCTWVLDSVESGKQFKDLFGEGGTIPDLGDDFTITAEVNYTGTDQQVNGARKTADDNSLFAKNSGDETVYIEYMRHLQNLRQDFSGVSSEKTKAEQIENIICTDGYNFQPIENNSLVSFDGQNHEIRNLSINYSTSGDFGAYGLFGQISGKSSEHKTISGIRLINASVSGSGTNSTGALIGQASYVDVDHCQVYWENTVAGQTNLRNILGSSESGFNYKVTGAGAVGGLVGSMSNGSITSCSASTTVQNSVAVEPVGGLVGRSGGGLTMTNSYSDSYLSGSYVGGLIGSLTGNASISGSYAVGYISSPQDISSKAAGFCLGTGYVTAEQSYSAMLYTKEANNFPLSESVGSYASTVYYLNSDFFSTANTASVSSHGKTYDTLTDQTAWSTLFGSDSVFEDKDASESHPYNLQTTLSLTAYSYPGIRNLDHYGDWGAQFQNGSLVYYEIYSDGNMSCGFNGGSLDLLEDAYAVKDGYAVAFRSNPINAQNSTTIRVTFYNSKGRKETRTLTYSAQDMYIREHEDNGKRDTYYLLPLPGDIVNTTYVSADFYQEITFTQGSGTETVEGHYYYNPHFANAVIPYEEDMDLSSLAEQLTVEIRTPRHLYDLSSYSVYYSSYHRYNFEQTMNLDYSIYTGYDLFTENGSGNRIGTQSPIGVDASRPFRNNYDGNCHTIENVVVDPEGHYVGLFGYSTGTIENTVYLVNENTTTNLTHKGSDTGTVYAGGLAGYNGGTIRNCAVAGIELDVYAYEYSTVYVGGLVGMNRGNISNSSAALTGVEAEATLANAYVGGFVGTNNNGGTISNCYAVGRIVASRSRYGNVYACGFAGGNQGSISRCYAAADLQVSGGAEAYGISKDATTNCVYMNKGNFQYNGTTYTAQYDDPSAAQATIEEFEANTNAAATLGMSMDVISYNKPNGENAYPYPGVVKNASGKTIHYGLWPEKMDLGVSGIYYWEKMEISGNITYHFSSIAADLDNGTMYTNSTLATAHDDGGVITEYGYGYFYSNGVETTTTLESSGIGYGNNTTFTPSAALENEAANEALSSLMSGRYIFHSYNTWGTAETGSGLYPSDSTPSGTWKLIVSDDSQVFNATISFQICPFFANAMSYNASESSLGGRRVKIDVTEAEPGTEDNPYEVRSIDQFQFINWNKGNKNTSTYLHNANSTNQEQFMFLSYSKNNKIVNKYYWLQTHDIDGSECTDYTPIAAFKDTNSNTTAASYGWFGGTYDGNDYTIQELSINNTEYDTTGLFGFTIDAVLKNIVIYSPSGNATIRAENKSNANGGSGARWYAIGGLVGLAATTQNSFTIENCSISGYTIIDANQYCGFGGGGVGGLVGICNMDLSKCTAVTNIQLAFEHNDGNRNVRVGGLAGSCQKSLSQCYAGGSITLVRDSTKTNPATSQSRVHIGGMVGGYFMKPLNTAAGQLAGNSSNYNTIVNCYSYVVLPSLTGIRSSNSRVFAIGGLGEINYNNKSIGKYENCYYLDTNVSEFSNQTRNNNILPDTNNVSGVTSCTYAELSNPESEVCQALYAAGFGNVTTATATGESINGKYSFATSQSLLGDNYPFPTILTQVSPWNENSVVNVHYGNWPVNGIERANGGLPVEIDLFTDYGAVTEKADSASMKETILLSELLKNSNKGNGTLSVTVENSGEDVESDAKVASAAFVKNKFTDGSAELIITGLRAGYAKVTVTYTVSATETYTTTIDVQVKAQLQLLPSQETVRVFTNETAQASLEIRDNDGKALPDEIKEKITFSGFEVEYDQKELSGASVKQAVDDEGDGIPGEAWLTVESSNSIGDVQITVVYTFEYLNQEYTLYSPVTLKIEEPSIELEPVHIYLEGSSESTFDYTSSKVKIYVGDEEASDIRIMDFKNSDDKNIVYAAWKDSDKTVIQIEGYKYGASEENIGYMQLELQFTYGGSIHTLWEYLPVYVHAGLEGEIETETAAETMPVYDAESVGDGDGL